MPLESAPDRNARAFALLERVLFLKEIDIFHNVEAERLSAVADIARELHVAAGDTVAREGDPGESLFIIRSGSLRVVKEKDGRQYALKNLSPGQTFGVFGILGDKHRAAGAVANEATVLLEIRKSEFKKMLLNNPEITYNILEILSERINEMDNEIVLLNRTLSSSLTGQYNGLDRRNIPTPKETV
ncbi:MAG: cyclic nucleotide-binding domain-containing protein [Fibrobacterota bacterium]